MARSSYSFSRLRRGIADRVPSTVTRDGLLLLFLLRTDIAGRPVPGLLPFGLAACCERYERWRSASAIKRALRELQEAGALMLDQAAKLVYCVGAIEDDGPRTQQAVKAWAARFHELPPSTVKAEIARATTTVLAEGDYEELTKQWHALTAIESGAHSASGSTAHSGAESAPDSSALPSPSPSPIPSPSPPPPPSPSPLPQADGRYLRAWARLPSPPFAAAAADALMKAQETMPLETFEALVIALGSSKWVKGEDGLRFTPTLQRLIADDDYRQRVLNGEFASRSTRWACPDCGQPHHPTADCPERCRGCGNFHGADQRCDRLEALQARERIKHQTPEEKSRIDAAFAQMRKAIGGHVRAGARTS